MSDERLTVVKVGGSLYDLPDLRERLRRWLDSLDTQSIILIPGGGAPADAVRAFDRTHHLGEEAAHWMAIHALSLNARFLCELLPDFTLAVDVMRPGRFVLDTTPFFRADEKRPDHLPHLWDVTSDSLAARAASLLGARELVLLKSVAWDGTDWEAASAADVVDRYFAQALSSARGDMHVRVVNLRMI